MESYNDSKGGTVRWRSSSTRKVARGWTWEEAFERLKLRVKATRLCRKKSEAARHGAMQNQAARLIPPSGIPVSQSHRGRKPPRRTCFCRSHARASSAFSKPMIVGSDPVNSLIRRRLCEASNQTKGEDSRKAVVFEGMEIMGVTLIVERAHCLGDDIVEQVETV